MTQAIANPFPSFVGLDGKPLSGGYVYIGAPNQDPASYPAPVYWDSGLTIAASQPLRTSAGYIVRNGAPSAIWTAAGYSIRVLDSKRRQVYYAAKAPNSDPLNVLSYGADPTGADSCVSAFQAAMAAVDAMGGGRLRIPAGTYYFNVTGDADTILIPSDCGIECDPGVVFKWGYWGSPLFAIVNKSNVSLQFNGAKFVWTGTFGSVGGPRDAFTYGKAIPAYEWCAHIACVGSEYVSVDYVRCEGLTTANCQNVFINVRGKSDNTTTKGNRFTRLYPDDVCQGMAFGEQERFEIDGIYSDRYSNASFGLYGAGHVLYVIAGATPSKFGDIRNIVDNAGTSLSAVNGAAHSVSLKSLQHSKVQLFSKRPDGALNFQDLIDVDIEVDYWSDSTDNISGNGPVFGIDPLVANKYVSIRGRVHDDAVRNNSAVNLSGIASGAKNLYCSIDLDITRTGDGTQSTAALFYVGNHGTVKLRHINKGTGAARVAVTVGQTSTDNNLRIEARGTVPNPRVSVSDPTLSVRNSFWCSSEATVDYDSNEFTPSNGNAIIWESARQYQSRKSLGTTTNPTGTFQLPQPGVYLVSITITAADFNLARTGLYWVVFDNASAFDFTTAQLVGTQVQKGGASGPTVMTLGVDADGLCTVTSTADSNTWLLSYGYRQLSADH